MPRVRAAGRHGERAGRDPRPRRGGHPRRERWPDGLDPLARRAAGLRRPPARRSRRSTGRRIKVVVDAGNGMAGHTAPAVFDRLADQARDGADVLRARRHLPEPRGQPDRAGQPRRPAEAGCSPRAPTSASPSTATPTAASSSTSAASWSRPRRDDRADRRPRARQGARRHGDPQPDHLPGGPRDRRRARRHTGAHPGGPLLHQGHDGRDRRDLRRRAQRPLLLPGLLARRLRHARRAARRSAALAEADVPLLDPAGVVRALSAERRDQQHRRRPGRGRWPSSSRRAPARDGVTIDKLDGLTVTHADWAFNVRASNTEPLLRLNAEGQGRVHHGPSPRRGRSPSSERLRRAKVEAHDWRNDPSGPEREAARDHRLPGRATADLALHAGRPTRPSWSARRRAAWPTPYATAFPVLLVDEARKPA